MRATPRNSSETETTAAAVIPAGNEPEPEPGTEADAQADERLDENLHFGRSWHRYRYCYRKSESLRVLDAGCGTGGSSLAAARLNPGASVLGLDTSTTAVATARRRASAAGLGSGGLEFAEHDLARPLPETFGQFDFVVCRQVLGHAAEPDRVLATLARALAPGGLVLATFPSSHGRLTSRALRRAVDALEVPGAGLGDRARIGLGVVQALRGDHPVRKHVAGPHARGSLDVLDADPDLTRAVAEALDEPREWSLDEAARSLEAAGLRFLYAAPPWRWQLERVFDPGAMPASLRHHLDQLDPDRLCRLIDALDPPALAGDYTLYACSSDHTPAPASWPSTRCDDPASFDRLVPHSTDLACAHHPMSGVAASRGGTLFRTVSGAVGELDRISVLRFAAVDGVASCGEIDRKFASHTRACDGNAERQECWINLADSGLILLEPPPAGGSTRA